MGHRPPYIAVITLCVMTAHHWRTMRLKLLQAGIGDPMTLPHMHMVLDATEAAVLEAIANQNAKDAEFKRSQFLDRLYSPVVEASLHGDTRSQIPAGFTEEEMEASFDAFTAAAH